jgi:pilus assembly protein CpaF
LHEELVKFGAFTEEMAAYLVQNNAPNIIVSGGTGSGKTTLNALGLLYWTTRNEF